MNNIKMMNFNQENVESVDKFLSDYSEGISYLQKTYAMVQTNTQSSVTITRESRKKCANSLIR